MLLVVPIGCGIEEVASMENWWKGEVGFMVGGSVVDCEDGGGGVGGGFFGDSLLGFPDSLGGENWIICV